MSRRRTSEGARGARQEATDGGRRLKVGEVSKLSGIGIEALRFYEKGGLIDKPSRTYGGYRVYGPEVPDRLAFIKRAQSLGFSLSEIKRIIEDARRGESPCEVIEQAVRVYDLCPKRRRRS